MDVVLLGTGNPLPHPDRAGPATLVRAGDVQVLVDCGRGVLMRLAAAGAFPGMLSAVLLTHLHSDHVSDFNDVVTTRWVMSPVEAPLTVVGPGGTRRFVERTLVSLEDDIGWRLAHHEDLAWEPLVDVTETESGIAFEDRGLRVMSAPTDHRPVHPTVGFRFEHDGDVVAVAGDTVPCEGLDRLCAGADVYVQTVVRPSLVEAVPMARFHDILDYHSSVEDAARTAARAGVRTLVLTHCVPPPAPGTEGEWIAEAAAHFDGEVLLVPDLAPVSTGASA
jgi:ribonuclease Z